MKIWKIILISTGVTLLTGYLIFALFFLIPSRDETICKGIQVEILNADKKQFVSPKEITQLINSNFRHITGEKITNIDLAKVEEIVLNHPMVKTAACYKIQNGNLKVDITQREPVFKIISGEQSYYIDIDRKMMPTSVYYSAYVPVVTGNVNQKFIKDKLFDFIVFLQNDKFLSSQIEQINICPDLEIELVPRIGQHIIFLGTLDNYKEKLERLKTFYEKGLNETGWNHYTSISLKYKDQVVCRKKQK